MVSGTTPGTGRHKAFYIIKYSIDRYLLDKLKTLTRFGIQPQPLLTRPLPGEDMRQNLQARAFLSRLRGGSNRVARIHKKGMGLDRVDTKAKPETRGWWNPMLGLGMVRI